MAINSKGGQGKGFGDQSKPEEQTSTQDASIYGVVDQGAQALEMIDGLLESNGRVLDEKILAMADRRNQSRGMGLAIALHPDVQDSQALGYAVNFLSSCKRQPVDVGAMEQSRALSPVQPLQLASLSSLYASSQAPQAKSKQLQSSQQKNEK